MLDVILKIGFIRRIVKINENGNLIYSDRSPFEMRLWTFVSISLESIRLRR